MPIEQECGADDNYDNGLNDKDGVDVLNGSR
jgi:hypothetical protein